MSETQQVAQTVDPGLALLLFGLGVIALAVVFWPRWGLFARIGRVSQSSERVRMEDALKHLHSLEYEGRQPSIESLAGVLGITRLLAARTLQHLEERDLVEPGADAPRLTQAGREYAIRILRTHRLWERYLADRTGMKPDNWHASAEDAEHALSPSETDSLASRLGHPLYDPHGDPIPTSAGDIPPLAGVPLSNLEPGRVAQITHLEDEPPEVFAQLTAVGLSPNLRISIVDRSPAGTRIAVGGVEHVLDSVAAANVTVRALPDDSVVRGSSTTLADTEVGETVRVVGISPACQGPQRRRLLDLGLVPGTEISAELVGTGGDPVAYLIRGALIALRHEQAALIEVDRIRPGAELPAEAVGA